MALEAAAPHEPPPLRDLIWVGASMNDLRDMSIGIRRSFGYTLHALQWRIPLTADIKHLVGVSDVYEIRKSEREAYRLVYWLHEEVIYVLHVFKKKSHHGVSTPREELKLVHARLQEARRIHQMEREK